jgi:methylglutaconyl-CoA hydratase
MTADVVRLEQLERGIAWLWLDRPDKGNCYDEAMLAGLARHLDAIDRDPSVRVLVLRGSGRYFCTGADLDYVRRQKTAKDAAGDETTLDDVLSRLDTLSKPTIAAVHGACLGGGLGLAICCDAVLATDSAFFGVPEIRLGFVPTTLLPYFVRAFGTRNLRRYGLSGERISAALAARLGIIHDLCSTADFERSLADVSDSMLYGAPRAVNRMKATLRGERTLVSDADADERDLAEGTASARERRPPRWYSGPSV